MKNLKYCPTCSSTISRENCIDSYMQCYRCDNGHRYFEQLKDVLFVDSRQASSIDSPSSNVTDDDEIIEYWLSSDGPRGKLNGQLALILQSIYDISKKNRKYDIDSLSYKYCPLCKGELENFDQSDGWVIGKKCGNGHSFYERGGKLWHKGTLNIVEDMDSSILLSSIGAWLKDKKWLKRQMHKEIRGILERFKKKVA